MPGIDAKFYHHGVTQQSHHRMENRDVAGARKIGARYLDHGIVPTIHNRRMYEFNGTARCTDFILKMEGRNGSIFLSWG
jgi:hypothetical protein